MFIESAIDGHYLSKKSKSIIDMPFLLKACQSLAVRSEGSSPKKFKHEKYIRI